MQLLEGFRVAAYALRANKLRSFLTTLGIVIGVAAVIAVVSIVQGLQFLIVGELQEVGATYLRVLPAVRFVAQRSLRSVPGFADFSHDFLGTPAQRQQAQSLARARLLQAPAQLAGSASPDLPLDADGLIEAAHLTEWLAARDLRPVRIAE